MKIDKICLILVILISGSLITVSQNQISHMYSYDAYFFSGAANHVVNHGTLIYDKLDPPISLEPTQITTNYPPTIATLQAEISILSNISTFEVGKIYSIILFTSLILLVFLITFEITKSKVASFVSALVITFTPIFFFRLNYIAAEQTATFLFLMTIFIIIKTRTFHPVIILTISGAVSIHPRSSIMYVPLILYFLYLVEGKEILSKNNMVKEIITFIICSPFIIFVIGNLLLYLQRGAAYPLFLNKSERITYGLLTSQLGIISIVIASIGLIYIIKNKHSINFIVPWLLANLFAIAIASYMEFPSNRLTLHIGILLAILSAFSFIAVKNVLSSKFGATIFIILIISLLPLIFISSPYSKPFYGWGEKEAEAMYFLRNLTENETDYIIISPDYPLLFGYDLNNIEFRENNLSNLLKNTRTEKEFLLEINSSYLSKNVYVFYTKQTESEQRDKFIFKSLNTSNIIFENSRTKIIFYKMSE